jgi:hypothetical protein
MGATRAAQGGVTLTNSNTLTINTWIKPTAVPPSLGFATITGITNNLDTPQWLDYPHFLVAMNENRQIVVGMWSADNTASITEVFTTQLVLNTTYQITVVYDYAATIKFRLFINGVESTSVGQTIDGWNWTTNGSLITTVQFVFHGGTATDSATSQFSGVIERTSIHSTALTQQEINTLYIQGTS